MNRNWIIGIVGLVIIAGGFLLFGRGTVPSTSVPTSDGVLQVVAGENFWGSLISQIGGSHVAVTTIVKDPAADPHDYEATPADARSFAAADYVILNGVGYDSWGQKIVSSDGKDNQKVLVVGDLVGKKDGDNPHLWYQPEYVNTAIAQMEKDLIAMDPSHTSDYQANYSTLQQSLAGYQNTIARIKKESAGQKVEATEDIFIYLVQATGLDLVTPQAFLQAVADGNDPPAASLAQFQAQLKSDTVRVFLYNLQTATPQIDNLKKIAEDQHIPVVGMTETVSPPDAPFQDWMGKQVEALRSALHVSTAQ